MRNTSKNYTSLGTLKRKARKGADLASASDRARAQAVASAQAWAAFQAWYQASR